MVANGTEIGLDSEPMRFEFADKKLERVASELKYTAGMSPALVKGFRKVLQAIRAADDERDLYDRPALRFEKLERSKHAHSLRANDQYRVIVEIMGVSPNKSIRVIRIEDYH